MNPFVQLRDVANEKNLEFIIIGGHAVNSHGYLRTTVDIDLMIPESQLESWKTSLRGLGYSMFHETSAFAQFHAATGIETFPIDIMIVSDETFGKVKARAETRTLMGAEHLVPRALELIALKLHALRDPVRAAKGMDLADILALARGGGLGLENPEFKAILERYADEKTRGEIARQLGR